MKPNINFDIISRFKAIICQQNVMFGIFSFFALLVIKFLGTVTIQEHSFFALTFIGLIIIVFLGLLIWIVGKTDSTESIEIHQGSNKIIIKSPSQRLMPALMNKLLESTPRPDKLIPENVDPKDDPSEFQPLTAEQQEAIVKQEVEVALVGEVVKK